MNTKILQQKGFRKSNSDGLISTKWQREHLSTAPFLVKSSTIEATTFSNTQRTTVMNMSNNTEQKTEPRQEDHGTVYTLSTSISGIGLLATLGLTLLVVFNLVFTLYFYSAWKKRQKMRCRQSVIEMRTYDELEGMPRAQREDVYSNIRESLYTRGSGSYTTIRSRDGDINGDISDRSTLLQAAPSQRGRNRDKVKTLTTLFETHSCDVMKKLSDMKTVNDTGE